MRLLQHDAAVNPGSSGGPLIDAAGRVVDMNSRIADGSRHCIGLSFAIAAPNLDRIVAGLIDGTLLPMPDLGLHLRQVSREIALALGVAQGGILVDRVATGSIADRAGLAAGDVIFAARGRALTGLGDLAFALDAALPAGNLPVTLLRGGIPLDRLITFATPGIDPAPRDTGGALVLLAVYRLAEPGLALDDTARVTGITDNSPALFAGLVCRSGLPVWPRATGSCA